LVTIVNVEVNSTYNRNCKCPHSTGLVVVIFKLGSNGIGTGKMQHSASQPIMRAHTPATMQRTAGKGSVTHVDSRISAYSSL
jgi:hypothetical protein